MRLVIPTSEGRLIEIVEGVLRLPPPKDPRRGPNTNKRVKVAVAKPKVASRPARGSRERADAIPGYSEWRSLRGSQIALNSPRTGKKLGMADGLTKFEASRLTKIGLKQAKRDMEVIKKNITFEDAASEEAMRGALEVLRTPTSQALKLQASKLIMEFTRAKPTTKSEVTVNAAEKWLESLGNDDHEDE